MVESQTSWPRWLGATVSVAAVFLISTNLAPSKQIQLLQDTTLSDILYTGSVNGTVDDSYRFDKELFRRLDKSPEWEAALKKGKSLTCLMNAPVYGATSSQYLSKKALDTFGWESTKLPLSGHNQFHVWGLDDAFKELNIPTAPGNWHIIADHHKKDTNGYPATEAMYHNIMNAHAGVIIAKRNYGPDHQASNLGIPPDKVVPLKKWSDLVFLEWQALTQGTTLGVKGLQHVFRYHVANKKTADLLAMAYANGDPEKLSAAPPPWPGWTWNINQDKAKVVLSAPNSYGVAYLLGTHKHQFGVKVIDKIQVFTTNLLFTDFTSMYFHIRDGPMEDDNLGFIEGGPGEGPDGNGQPREHPAEEERPAEEGSGEGGSGRLDAIPEEESSGEGGLGQESSGDESGSSDDGIWFL